MSHNINVRNQGGKTAKHIYKTYRIYNNKSDPFNSKYKIIINMMIILFLKLIKH